MIQLTVTDEEARRVSKLFDVLSMKPSMPELLGLVVEFERCLYLQSFRRQLAAGVNSLNRSYIPVALEDAILSKAIGSHLSPDDRGE